MLDAGWLNNRGQFAEGDASLNGGSLTLQEQGELFWGDFEHFSSWADTDNDLLGDAVEDLLWEGKDGWLLLVVHLVGDDACADQGRRRKEH